MLCPIEACFEVLKCFFFSVTDFFFLFLINVLLIIDLVVVDVINILILSFYKGEKVSKKAMCVGKWVEETRAE